MGPILSLWGPTCDPKWPQNGALGPQNEAKMTPKWSLGANKNACEKWTPKKSPKRSSGHHFGVPFWSHFWLKIDAKNEAEKRWVQNGVLDGFWWILGSFFDSCLRLLGPRRPKKGERVKMWKWAPRLSEKLTFEDWWGSEIDKKRPETRN